MTQTAPSIGLSADERAELARLLEHSRTALSALVASCETAEEATGLGLQLEQLAVECEAVEDASLLLTAERLHACLDLITDVAVQTGAPADVEARLAPLVQRLQQSRYPQQAAPTWSVASDALVAQEAIDTDA